MSLPTGTVTFLFTDIEGSTKLWEQFPDAMRHALTRHDAMLHQAIETHGGRVFKTVGDAFCAAFPLPAPALLAALDAQRALHQADWGEITHLRVRMALHSGTAQERSDDYFGSTLNRVARLLAVGHGEQILLSQAAKAALGDTSPVTLQDLGSHRLKDLALPEHVWQACHPDLAADFPPLRSLQAFANNLPLQITSFVGREAEITAIKQMLTRTRLLTLTGSGGCGKTRLSLQVAADLLETYGDGVWLTELAPLTDPALVPQSVASALGVREEPGRSLLDTLTDYLRAKSILLVLDNCEHVLDAAAQLAETLLRSCPGVSILASSREGLGIAGERAYRIPSLSQPDPRQLPSLAEMSQYESVRLFVERAETAAPAFRFSAGNAQSVARVCARLDGIPLALELAAARVRSLPVEQIASRLDDRFRLLTGGSRTALPRQQTLRALIDWSYDLLDGASQTLLRRLSVFAGGWTLEAAEAVCAGGEAEDWAILDLLTGLVDKSLVVYEEPEGQARYRLLETVRQYGRDRLLESGEGEAVRGKHRDYFLQLAETAEPELGGPEQVAWLNRLETEHDNLRAALEWCESDASGAEAGLRLTGALRSFWWTCGYDSEGQARLKEALVRNKGNATLACAKALGAAGNLGGSNAFATSQSCHQQSREIYRAFGDRRGESWCLAYLAALESSADAALILLEESLALFRGLEDKQGSAFALDALGDWSYRRGNYGNARTLYLEAFALFEELGNKRGVAFASIGLGHVAIHQGDYAAAHLLYDQALTLHQETKNKNGILMSLRGLGMVAAIQGNSMATQTVQEQILSLVRRSGWQSFVSRGLCDLGDMLRLIGDFQEAKRLYAEAFLVKCEVGNSYVSFPCRLGLGYIAVYEGDYSRAATLFRECRELAAELNDPEMTPLSISGFASVASSRGNWVRAAKLLGVVSNLCQLNGIAFAEPSDKADYARNLASARAGLSEESFAAAWAAGRAMTMEQATAYAIEETQEGEGDMQRCR